LIARLKIMAGWTSPEAPAAERRHRPPKTAPIDFRLDAAPLFGEKVIKRVLDHGRPALEEISMAAAIEEVRGSSATSTA
jgi:hypothetical protein